MNNSISIIFLWAEVGSYLEAVLNILPRKTVGTIGIVHWDQRGLNSTKHVINVEDNVAVYPRSQTNDMQILAILKKTSPEIIVISGWMDKGYIWACKKYKNANSKVKIVAGIDDIWIGSIRQRVGQIYYKIFYRKLFEFMWISGQPQFSFAQRFGYDNESIISNLYSADTEKFEIRSGIIKRFIFVGRFVKIKALDLLVQSYCRLPENVQNEWPLLLIGDGDQKSIILEQNNPNIKILPFLQPEELRRELLKGGVGCLPSHKDQWGVVLHEYALMGLPMLVSSGCGAVTEFLISGFNGFMFRKSDVNDLHRAMNMIISLTDEEFSQFCKNSTKLGARITSDISVASLLSVCFSPGIN